MMEIPKSVLSDMVRSSVKIGDVFYIEMNEADGITPKNGASSRSKFFLVLGFDDMGNAYGGVVINSHVNQRMGQIVQDYQMPIKCAKYPFLKYDSFVNCLTLKTSTLDKLTEGRYVGAFDEEDLHLTIETLKSSPREKEYRLKLYHII